MKRDVIGWLDGLHDSSADGLLIESVRFHEDVTFVEELFPTDMQTLRGLGL